jgi:phospholipase C
VPAVVGGAVDGGPTDPLHDFNSITQQVFGFAKPMGDKTSPARMNGFVANAAASAKEYVMNAFNFSQLPTLSTLATEFALFDAWHPSLPTCTNPNREFMMSGTSHGYTSNAIPDAGFPQQTHFGWLAARNVTSKIYYQDDPWMAPCFAELRSPAWLARTLEMPAFFDDLASGGLAQFSLLQPRMATSATGPSTWQHPDNSVEAGELFYAEVYEALRLSPYWNSSLLLITYDEHGGFFDHAPPPAAGVPAPDAVPFDNGFDGSRLGVRVPAVAISPWIAKGSVIGAPAGAQAPTPTSQWDHTSIIATANRIFGLEGAMTARDAWAGHFDGLVDGSSPLRADCPLALPRPPAPAPAALAREAARPLNDHHLDSLNLECHLAGHAHPVCARFAGDRAPFLADRKSVV